MTQNELTKAIFWQLIAFSKLEENPQNEFSTSPILFEFAKTQGIKNTLQAFQTLENYNLISTNSPIFKTISMTPKAFLLDNKENAQEIIKENKTLKF